MTVLCSSGKISFTQHSVIKFQTSSHLQWLVHHAAFLI